MIKELEQNLKSYLIKPTAMRLLVLDCLLDREATLSLTDLYEAFEKSDRTTLNRLLQVFEENGMVHSIVDGTGVTKYALCSAACNSGNHDNAYIHFHCDQCGKNYCLPKFKIPSYELPEKFSKREVILVVKGKYADCTN